MEQGWTIAGPDSQESDIKESLESVNKGNAFIQSLFIVDDIRILFVIPLPNRM